MKKLFAAIVIAAAGAAFAETTPAMVSLRTPVQIPARDYDVKGIRLSLIYGECETFKGLDIGIINNTTADFTGLAIGGGNISRDRFYGAALGFVNCNGSSSSKWDEVSKGCQVGFVNYAESFCGLQKGLLNIAGGTFTGLQNSFLNFADDMNGLQCSPFWIIFGVNVASGTVRGCQIGLVNYAGEIDKGLQIGLVNILDKGGIAPVFPIINGNFR